MFVKKFEVNNFEEGLKQIRSELGPDALIVKTVRKKAGVFSRGQIEITAAVKDQSRSFYSSDGKVRKNESSETLSLTQIFPHREKQSQSAKKEKNQSTVKYIDVAGTPVREQAGYSTKKGCIDDFTRLGISKSLSSELAHRLDEDRLSRSPNVQGHTDLRLSILSKRIRTIDLIELSKKKRIAMVGAAGSGKTMAIVKLALALKARNQPVAISSLDTRKVCSSFELHQYGKLVKVPVKKIDEVRGREIQLVDTPSLRLDSEESNWDLVKRLSSRPTSVCLCIEATLRLSEMIRILEVTQRFFPVEGIFVTKVDLATLTGVLFELSHQTKVPICGVNTSQSFKSPLEVMNPTKLGEMIIQRGVTS